MDSLKKQVQEQIIEHMVRVRYGIGDGEFYAEALHCEACGYITEEDHAGAIVVEYLERAFEVERLRKVESELRGIVDMRTQLAEALRAEAVECDALGLKQTAQFSRDNADRLMAEVWPLEAVLGE